MNTNELWQAVLGELELTLSKPNFTTWFKNTFIANAQDGEAVVCVPNTFTKAWLEKKYHTSIVKSLQHVTNGTIKKIVYRVETKIAAPIQINTEKETVLQSTESDTSMFIKKSPPKMAVSNEQGLNPRYTFENFIVGKGNELAHAAAQAIVQSPGTTYNPLFVYGGVGLGKTHLIQAIGHALLQRNNRTRILYASCEKFTNDFIHAVRSGHAKEFKDTYRNVDVLLIDDIQFITGKEGTQEEFFHTFNTLHQSNRQIIISSDRPPKAIPALEHRLLSRFEWGMTADISNPDLETRIAILGSKSRAHNFEISHELLHLIAGSIQSNVRELEGALVKIIAFHKFKKMQPTEESIKPILSGFGQSSFRSSLTPKQLISIVSQYFDVNIEDLLGKSREKRLAFPRQIIMYLMREELKSSFPAIGNEIGGRDHTTAMHACLKITRELTENDRLRQDMESIKQRMFIP